MTAVQGIVHAHFAAFQGTHPEATLRLLDEGSAIVHVPNVPLDSAWNKGATTVSFFVPVGYPAAQLDCFWADTDLLLANGQPIANAGLQAAPWGENALWFSYHVQSWHPARDTLSTYFQVILKRLADGK